VADGVKVILPRDAFAQLHDFLRAELHNSAAPAADHVVVGVLAVGQLVVRLFDVKTHLLEYSAIDEQRERSIDSLRMPSTASSTRVRALVHRIPRSTRYLRNAAFNVSGSLLCRARSINSAIGGNRFWLKPPSCRDYASVRHSLQWTGETSALHRR
jgi:hypothetical protein